MPRILPFASGFDGAGGPQAAPGGAEAQTGPLKRLPVGRILGGGIIQLMGRRTIRRRGLGRTMPSDRAGPGESLPVCLALAPMLRPVRHRTPPYRSGPSNGTYSDCRFKGPEHVVPALRPGFATDAPWWLPMFEVHQNGRNRHAPGYSFRHACSACRTSSLRSAVSPRSASSAGLRLRLRGGSIRGRAAAMGVWWAPQLRCAATPSPPAALSPSWR